jgi:hypothetical protein
MKRILLPVALLAAVSLLASCGNKSATGDPQPLPNIAGAWEMIAAPATYNGKTTGIEVALKEGTTLITSGMGGYAPNGQVSASGTQIAFMGINVSGINTDSFVFGGNCPITGPDTNANNLAGGVTAGGQFNFTYDENGNDFSVNAMLSADGQSLMGSYTSQAGSNCADGDSGTITGLIVPKLSGTYLGKLCSPSDSTCSGSPDSANATLSEKGSVLNVSLVLTGTDNTTLSLSGTVAGNYFSVQGTFQGQTVAYYGYYQETFDPSDGLNDIQTIYLANVASPSQLAGQLTVPLQPGS